MNGEIIQAEESNVPVIADDRLVALAEAAEKRVDAMNKIKKIALKVTNHHDWIDQNGKPYLQVSGAEKVGRLFGISWRIDEPVLDHGEGSHFGYTYKGYFSLSGVTIEAIGSRSSKDGFFKKYSGKGDERTELPPSEIDRGDVKKSAYTNCIGNGITRLLGIRNLTYDDLQEFAGITKDQIAKVDYKKAGKSDSGIASEGAKTVVITVNDVRKKDGKNQKTGKPYTIYTIKNGNAEYSTFSETYATKAKEAKDSGRQVVITYTVGQYGNNLEALVFADDGPGSGGKVDDSRESA